MGSPRRLRGAVGSLEFAAHSDCPRASDAVQRNREQRKRSWDPPRDRNSEQFLLLYQPTGDSQYASADRFMSCSGATLEVMRRSVLSTTPTAEKPALSDEERAERRRRLAERVFSPGGLDRDTLEHIEQLTDNES